MALFVLPYLHERGTDFCPFCCAEHGPIKTPKSDFPTRATCGPKKNLIGANLPNVHFLPNRGEKLIWATNPARRIKLPSFLILHRKLPPPDLLCAYPFHSPHC